MTAGADNDIQLVCDDDGLAIIGDPMDVEQFLASEGLSSKDLGLRQFRSVIGTGAVAAQAASEIAANSGRWAKLTPESARLVKKYGLRKNSETGLSTGVVKGAKGQIKDFVEFARAPRSLLANLTNPAVLANAAGVMAQIAMQQTMDEITDYLTTIDAKVDDILRAQQDAALSRMIGVGFVLDEAMILRDERGRVDEITWSKVHGAPATIAETQAYALRQLDALAEGLERKTKVGDLATAAGEAESAVREWLAVLARCFQLQDAIAVLELDRVLDASPEEVGPHRLGLKAARQRRLEVVAGTTEQLTTRMNAVVGTANAKVLLHPAKSPAAVQSSIQVADSIHEFHSRLGIESHRPPSEARRWATAASEARDRALATGAKGVDAARGLGSETLDRAGSLKDRFSGGNAKWTRGRRGEHESESKTPEEESSDSE
ncbi:putative transcriptional regulator [Catenulispora sp. MAP5-51]|uniref:hypothetical protein n=1 Tax=Catenulispora sp. MAP5-51 TaxID=3156298 RepID=UPI003519BCAF